MIRVHDTNANNMQIKIIYWLSFINDISRIKFCYLTDNNNLM